ncbi:MAG: amino acid adenylation domain-containing protein, partial [Microbacterium sp.]
ALASVEPAGLDRLEVVVVGGEACPPELVERWAPGRRMFNAYGPTEATVMSNVSDLVPGRIVEIGGPIRGAAVYVLDDKLRPVPVGVAGELYVAGPALARGYHKRSGLTAERFVANPFGAPGDRLYRTGDVVRWTAVRPGGYSVEYVGRSDFQVKVRGFRIELGEIDAALVKHPDLEFAATLGTSMPSGSTALVSYVLPTAGAAVDVSEVTHFVGDTLPAHMVPSAVVVLDEIPLTTAGKLDRNALPEPDFDSLHGDMVEPRTPIEELVAGVLADVLGLAKISVVESFFDLGGNSLVATKAVARLNAAAGTRLGVRELFDAPTVERLAVKLAELAGAGSDRPILVAGPRPERVPLSMAQQSMWLMNRFDTASSAYNIPLAVRLSGSLDIDAMSSAVSDVLARHESLRTVFPDSDDGPYQQVVDTEQVPFDLTPVPVTEAELHTALSEFATEGFDVTVAPPLRIRLFATSESEFLLVLVVHHICADGASMSPLARDVMVAYSARTAGAAPLWQPLPVQYPDFALWQREVLGDPADTQSLAAKQIAYWSETLSGTPELLELPTDRPRPSRQSMRGDFVDFGIQSQVYDGLERLATARGASLFMVTHTALAILLSRLSGTDDIAIGTPTAARHDQSLDDLVGMFVNTLVLRTEVHAGDGFGDLLARVREHDLNVFENSDVPFESLVETLRVRRSTAYSPLFQVMLSFQNNRIGALELPGLSVRVLEDLGEGAKYDLTLTLTERVDDTGRPVGLSGRFTYATDLFERASVERIAARFVRILRAVVTDPDVSVGDIDILTERERAKLTPVRPARTMTVRELPQLLAAAVDVAPDAVAVAHDGMQVTYREFDERLRLMSAPLSERGMGPDAIVSVVLSGLVPTIMMAPPSEDGKDGFGAILDTVIADAHALVGDVDLEKYTAAPIVSEQAAPAYTAAARPESPLAAWHDHVQRDPDAVVVVGGGVATTRAELNGRANQMARELANRGVRADDVVALIVPRSLDWVVGMLAAWKVGAAYSPLDQAWPLERIAGLVETSGARVAITTSSWRELGRTPLGDTVLDEAVVLDAPDTVAALAEYDARDLGFDPWTDDEAGSRLAYVISTSGSTGRPKPTMVPMVGVMNTYRWYRDEIRIGDGTGVLVASSPLFDLTQKNVWVPLISGGVLHLAAEGFDPADILRHLAMSGVRVVNMAPSAFELLAELDVDDRLASLDCVVLGGEQIRPAAYAKLIGRGVRLVNSYGPTEASDVSASYELDLTAPGAEATPIPIGSALPGADYYVLDKRLRPVPTGVTGELYIGGVVVGRGYGGMTGTTAARFVANPHGDAGARMYRTGDLVRERADGELIFLGRSDFQVKIRGLRVELGEIESALTAMDEVKQSVVVVHERDGLQRLVGYVTAPADATVAAHDVSTHLRSLLPSHMVPDALVVLDEMPLNSSGKVDRKALPAPEFAVDTAEFVAPRTPLEEIVATIFGDVVGVDRVSVDASFFDLGGNSLSATRVAARLSSSTGAIVGMRDLFEAPTVAELAAFVEQQGGDGTARPALVAQDRPQEVPLSLAQQRMWFLNRFDPASPAYNVPLTVRLRGELNVAAIASALKAVVARHEVLRTVFPDSDSGAHQVILP